MNTISKDTTNPKPPYVFVPSCPCFEPQRSTNMRSSGEPHLRPLMESGIRTARRTDFQQNSGLQRSSLVCSLVRSRSQSSVLCQDSTAGSAPSHIELLQWLSSPLVYIWEVLSSSLHESSKLTKAKLQQWCIARRENARRMREKTVLISLIDLLGSFLQF